MTTRTTTLVVTPSALDALSHYQLQRPTQAFYASTSGLLTDNKVAELRRVLESQAIKTVKLAFASTLAGHLADTYLLTGLAHLSTPMRVERNLPSLLTVAIHSGQDEPVSKLLLAIKAHNAQVTEAYRRAAGLEVVTAAPALDSELIKPARVGTHSYLFHVPKHRATLASFNQALINSFPLAAKLELDKPRAANWSAQLKPQREQVLVASPKPAPVAPVAESAPGTPRARRGPRQ